MTSRRMVVPIDIENPNKIINDYLYPKSTSHGVVLHRVSSNKEWKYGIVILKGGGITEKDLFAKIVNAKTEIESVAGLLNSLTAYLEKINEFSIGNIVYIESANNEVGFVLKKYADRLSAKPNRKLP